MVDGNGRLVGDRLGDLRTARPRSQRRSPARPRRILIVEDDLVIALMMEEIVGNMGSCAVSGIAGTLGMARLQFAKRDFDAVLLDVNLGGEYNPEIGDLLLEMGVPFAFVTGYDYVVEPQARQCSLTAEALLIHSATGSRRATARVSTIRRWDSADGLELRPLHTPRNEVATGGNVAEATSRRASQDFVSTIACPRDVRFGG